VATIRCPQCGTDVQEGTEFCPNPNCGFPLSFSKEPEAETEEIPMERRPLEKAPVQPVPQPQPQPQPIVTPPPVPPPTPPAPPPAKSGANPALLIGAVLVAVAAIAAVVIVLAGGDDEEKAAPKPPPEEAVELTFTRVPHDELVFGGDFDQAMHRVAAGEDELIAVGSDGPEGEFDAAVWLSSDGRAWERVRPDDPLTFGGEGAQEMYGVTAGPEGRYVIVGSDIDAGLDEDAAVWTYDGLVFVREDPTQSALGGQGKQAMSRVIRSAERYIGVGTTGLSAGGVPADGPDAGLWLSVDGKTWVADHSQLQLQGAGDQWMRTIVPFEDGFVGAGRELKDGLDAAVWKSDSDFTSFRRTGTTDVFRRRAETQIFSVAAGGPGLVAVGVAGSGGNPDAAVWTSSDGDNWEPIEDDDFGGEGTQLMLGVASTPAGIVAVGYDGSQVPDGVSGEEAMTYFDGAVWQSSDGETWERVLSAEFGGKGEQQIKSVEVLDDTLVLVGWDGSEGDLDAAVWTAPLQ
jgi:hypothetical protein